MRKTIVCILACLLFTGPFLADVCAQGKSKVPQVTFSGDAQFRLRYHATVKKDSDGEKIDPTLGDYTNQYAWNFITRAKVNENMMLGFRLSNPTGYASDKISDNITDVFNDGFRFLAIPEAFFKWNAGGVFHIAGGIIPVLNNVTLTLVAFETAVDKNDNPTPYAKAGKSPWKVMTNNSQTGIDLGFTFVNDGNTSLGFGMVSAIATDDPKGASINDQLRFIFTVPLSVLEKKLSFLPVMHMRTNVFESTDKEESNLSVAGGMDIGIKPVDQFGATVGFAVGGYNNTCQEDDAGYVASAPFGLLTEVGLVVKPGFGKAILTFRYSNWKDREVENADGDVISNSMIHFDVKYGIPILKLTLMPRFRVWHYINSDADDESATTDLRPELFFIGKF